MTLYETLKKNIPIDMKLKLRWFQLLPVKYLYLLSSILISNYNNIDNLRSLKNKYRKKRCFIIGSGPSISQLDLSPLKNQYTFGHNAFYLIENDIGFLPTFYVIEDMFPAEDNSLEINALTNTHKIFPHDLKYCLHPSKDTTHVLFNRYYADDSTSNWPKFSSDVTKHVYWGGTVVYMSIQLAAYMGFSEIYLLGIDLTYTLPKDWDGEEVISSTEDDENHFHKKYFGAGKRWHDPRVDRMQKSFTYAYNFLKGKNIQLINATEGGNLKVVPRKSYSSLF
jgi:hypothetical protein